MEKSETDFNTSTFPGKLWSLVNDPQISSVCWDPSGEGVLIYEDSFETEVLKSHTRRKKTSFKTSNFSSFIRQMNLYGFKKVRPAKDILSQALSVCLNMGQPHHFENPNFREAKPELLVKMKRLIQVKKTKTLPHTEVPSQSSRRMNYARAIKSLQEKSAEMSKGSALVEPVITPHHSSRQPCDRLSGSSNELVARQCGPSPLNAYANHIVPRSGFCYVPVDTHVSSPMLVEQVPQDNQYRVHSPVYHSESGFMNSDVPFDQPPAASYPPYGYYPESSVGYGPHSDGTPEWNSGYFPDSWQSYLEMDVDILLQSKELQTVPEGSTDMPDDLDKVIEELF